MGVFVNYIAFVFIQKHDEVTDLTVPVPIFFIALFNKKFNLCFIDEDWRIDEDDVPPRIILQRGVLRRQELFLVANKIIFIADMV